VGGVGVGVGVGVGGMVNVMEPGDDLMLGGAGAMREALAAGARRRGAGRRKKGKPRRPMASLEEAGADIAGAIQEARARGDEKLRKLGIEVKEEDEDDADDDVPGPDVAKGGDSGKKFRAVGDGASSTGGGAGSGIGSDGDDDSDEDDEDDEDDDEYVEDEDLMLAHMGVSRGPQHAKWDAATIVSTFSTGEHLPTVVGGMEEDEEGCAVGGGIYVEGVGRRRRKVRTGQDA